MSLDRALQRLATQIDSGRDAKLRMRLGTVDSYTPGSAEVSVIVGGDTVDAPFISGYTPAAGDRVIVLFNAGSPIVVGASGTAPVNVTTGPVGRADYECTTTPSMSAAGGFGWVAPNGTLSSHASYGDTSSIVYDSVELGVSCTEAGWYRIAATVLVDSARSGDALSLAAYAGIAGDGDHYIGPGIAAADGRALLSATSPEIYVSSPSNLLASFTVTNETAARGRIATGRLIVVRLS